MLAIDRTRRPLGRSGIDVFPLAYGCWRFAGTDVPSARAKIDAALQLGIELFDTADIYGVDSREGFGSSEALLGKVLAEAPGLREDMLLATKCGIVPGVPYDSSANYVRSACEASLRRLGCERIDLFQIHRPDWLAHPAEVAAVLSELRESGKIREAGVSNYTVAQTEALQAHLPFPLATHQPEFSAWCLDPLRDGVLDQCMRRGMTALAWSPLAGGRLGHSPEQARALPDGERLHALIERLDEIARAQGVTPSAVALAFVLAHPSGMIPIVGTQRVERLRESVRAFEVDLDRTSWYTLVVASEGAALP